MCWSRILYSNFTLESLEKFKKKIPMSRLPPKPIESEYLRVVSSHQYFEMIHKVNSTWRRLRNTVLRQARS